MTTGFDEAAHPREAGGQFAAKHTLEADGGLAALESPEQDTPIAGRGITEGDSLWLDDAADGQVINRLEIVRSEDGYFAEAGHYLGDMRESLRETMPEEIHGDQDAEDAWLNERGQIIEDYLRDRYGAEDMTGDQWGNQELVFVQPLDGTETEERAVAKVWEQTGIVRLTNEEDAGSYGCPYLYDELSEHLRTWDERAGQVASGYLAAAVWTDGERLEEEGWAGDPDHPGLDDDLDPEAARQLRSEALGFAYRHREHIEHAMAAGGDYASDDWGQVGHDLWLTRNRHGAGFWDRSLGEAGDKLTEAAHGLGEQELLVTDDGKISWY